MIQTAYDYKEYLRLDEVYSFMKVMVQYIKDGNSTGHLIDLEAKRHLHILAEIDNADFEESDPDYVPF